MFVLGAIPRRVEVLVVQPKVRAEIDDVANGATNLRDDRLTDAVRQTAKDEVEAIDEFRAEWVEGAIAVCRSQARVEVRDRCPCLAVARGGHELEIWVSVQQSHKFCTRIAGRANDSHSCARRCLVG